MQPTWVLLSHNYAYLYLQEVSSSSLVDQKIKQTHRQTRSTKVTKPTNQSSRTLFKNAQKITVFYRRISTYQKANIYLYLKQIASFNILDWLLKPSPFCAITLLFYSQAKEIKL